MHTLAESSSSSPWGVVLRIILLLAMAGGVGVLLVQHNVNPSMAQVGSRPLPERCEQPYCPDTVWFAGERVPLELVDVRESLDWELCVAANWHSHILLMLKRSARIFPIIEPLLRAQGIPDDFKYLAAAESSLNPRATSPAKAVGTWQILEGTARDYGLVVNADVDERYHLEKSTLAVCNYLKKSRMAHGSWTMAAAAYNIGHGGAGRQMAQQAQQSYYDLYLNVETGRYVFRIIALKLIMEHPERYGFYLHEGDKYQPLPSREIVVDSTINDLSSWAQYQGTNFKMVKWLNPWLRSSSLHIDSGRTYRVKILSLQERNAVYTAGKK